MKRINISNDGSYFLLMTLLYVICPFVSFVIALLLFRNRVSQFFFVAYAFYFGFQLGAQLDLSQHWNNYQNLVGKSFGEMWSDIVTLYLGKEPYHILLKWFLSKFYITERTFSGIAAAMYATIFIFFIRQFKDYYSGGLKLQQFLVLSVMTVTVEYYWYLGLRFWTAGFFFMTVYCRYIITGKKKWLLTVPIAALFHIVFVVPVIATAFVEITRNNRIVQIVLVVISLLYKYVNFGFMKFMASLSFVKMFYKSSYQNKDIQASMARRAKDYYESGNVIYQSRIPLMLFFSFVFFYFLWAKNRSVFKSYSKMSGLILIMFAISNFGYSDYVFYDRFLKLTCLISYSYLFLLLFEKKNAWFNNHLFFCFILFIIIISSLAIALFQERAYISDISLWFGNFLYLLPINKGV